MTRRQQFAIEAQKKRMMHKVERGELPPPVPECLCCKQRPRKYGTDYCVQCMRHIQANPGWVEQIKQAEQLDAVGYEATAKQGELF